MKKIFILFLIILIHCNTTNQSIKDSEIPESRLLTKKQFLLKVIKEISDTLQKTREMRSIKDKLNKSFYYKNMQTLYIGYLENSDKNKMFEHLNRKMDQIIGILEKEHKKISSLNDEIVDLFFINDFKGWRISVLPTDNEKYFPKIELMIPVEMNDYRITCISFRNQGKEFSGPSKDYTITEEDNSELTEGKKSYLFLREVYTTLQKTKNINSIKKYLSQDLVYKDQGYAEYRYFDDKEDVINRLNLKINDILDAFKSTLDNYLSLESNQVQDAYNWKNNHTQFLRIYLYKRNDEYKIKNISYENRL